MFSFKKSAFVLLFPAAVMHLLVITGIYFLAIRSGITLVGAYRLLI